MGTHYKHGDRVIWGFIKHFRGNRKLLEKNGTFIRIVEGNNPFGKVLVEFDGNKNRSRVHQYELSLNKY